MYLCASAYLHFRRIGELLLETALLCVCLSVCVSRYVVNSCIHVYLLLLSVITKYKHTLLLRIKLDARGRPVDNFDILTYLTYFDILTLS